MASSDRAEGMAPELRGENVGGDVPIKNGASSKDAVPKIDQPAERGGDGGGLTKAGGEEEMSLTSLGSGEKGGIVHPPEMPAAGILPTDGSKKDEPPAPAPVGAAPAAGGGNGIAPKPLYSAEDLVPKAREAELGKNEGEEGKNIDDAPYSKTDERSGMDVSKLPPPLPPKNNNNSQNSTLTMESSVNNQPLDHPNEGSAHVHKLTVIDGPLAIHSRQDSEGTKGGLSSLSLSVHTPTSSMDSTLGEVVGGQALLGNVSGGGASYAAVVGSNASNDITASPETNANTTPAAPKSSKSPNPKRSGRARMNSGDIPAEMLKSTEGGDDEDDDDDEVEIPPHIASKIVETSPAERYIRFKEKLGAGAYKDVYRAFDTIEGIEVAWNVVKLSGCPKAERIRIVNEVRLLERLHHPNIISFHGSWVNRETEKVVFVTEILSSGTLKSFVQKVQLIRWKIFKRWAIQILKGLEYLHSQDPPIIHRDLKCDNIFINGTSGDLRIGDFGLSTAITKKNQPLSVLGTPEFMAPELYDESYNEKVDIYAFGMLLLEIITRDVPYHECSNPAQIYKKVTLGIPPASLRRVKSEDARDFILFCLGIGEDADSRPSASELLKHPFLTKNSDDETTIEVEPAVEDMIIEETQNSMTFSETGSSSEGSRKNEQEGVINNDKFSSSIDGHQIPARGKEASAPKPQLGKPPRNDTSKAATAAPPKSAVDTVSDSKENKADDRAKSEEEQGDDQYGDLPANEINMKKVTVLMGRDTKLDDDDDKVESRAQKLDEDKHSALPRTNSETESSLGSPSLQYKVTAVPPEGTKDAYQNDEINLALTLPDEGKTTIEFEFDLVNDDPVQVAREMVTELDEVPDDAVLDISGAISSAAREARMRQSQLAKLQQQAQAQQQIMQQQAMQQSHVQPQLPQPQQPQHQQISQPQQMPQQIQPQQIAPLQQQVQHQQVAQHQALQHSQPQGMVLTHQGIQQAPAGTIMMQQPPPPVQQQQQQQQAHLYAGPGYTSAPQAGNFQTTHSAPVGSDMGVGPTINALQQQAQQQQQGQSQVHPPQPPSQMPTPQPPQQQQLQQMQQQHIPSSPAIPRPSSQQFPPTQHTTAPSMDLNSQQQTSELAPMPSGQQGLIPASSSQDIIAQPPPTYTQDSSIHQVASSSTTTTAHNQQVSVPLQQTQLTAIMPENPVSASASNDPSSIDQQGNVDESMSDDDSEEIRKLEEEFRKKMQRASKSYGTRMDNLHRSKEEADAQHNLTLQKHEKERVEFEKRVKLAEDEQARRLDKLQKEFDEKKKEMRQQKVKVVAQPQLVTSSQSTELQNGDSNSRPPLPRAATSAHKRSSSNYDGFMMQQQHSSPKRNSSHSDLAGAGVESQETALAPKPQIPMLNGDRKQHQEPTPGVDGGTTDIIPKAVQSGQGGRAASENAIRNRSESTSS